MKPCTSYLNLYRASRSPRVVCCCWRLHHQEIPDETSRVGDTRAHSDTHRSSRTVTHTLHVGVPQTSTGTTFLSRREKSGWRQPSQFFHQPQRLFPGGEKKNTRWGRGKPYVTFLPLLTFSDLLLQSMKVDPLCWQRKRKDHRKKKSTLLWKSRVNKEIVLQALLETA